MGLRLNGSTSGYTEIDAPASAGNNTLKLPTGNGSDGNILGTDGAGNLSWVNGRMVLETAQTTTSGTFKDFTGIPSWVKRVTVMFNGVSLTSTADLLVQLGTSGGIENTGYASSSSGGATTINTFSSVAGFIVAAGSNAVTQSGHMVITNISGNIWISSHMTARSDAASTRFGGGTKTLGGTLTQLRITNEATGTNSFDAGSINILYEG
jgi:hypothetical protein